MSGKKGTIGILTGGGDVPGLNAAIKAVVNRADQHGHEVLGLRRGWAGLLNVDPGDPASMPARWVNIHSQTAPNA